MAEWKCKGCLLYQAENTDAYRVAVGKYDEETGTVDERFVVEPLCGDCLESFTDLGY